MSNYRFCPRCGSKLTSSQYCDRCDENINIRENSKTVVNWAQIRKYGKYPMIIAFMILADILSYYLNFSKPPNRFSIWCGIVSYISSLLLIGRLIYLLFLKMRIEQRNDEPIIKYVCLLVLIFLVYLFWIVSAFQQIYLINQFFDISTLIIYGIMFIVYPVFYDTLDW